MGYRPKSTNTSSTFIDVYQLVPSNPSNNHEPDMLYAFIIKEGGTFLSDEGPEFILEKDINFKTDTEFEPLDISVYSINNSTNKPEYYLLRKRAKVHSGKRKIKKFDINQYTKFLTLDLPDTDIVDIESIVDTDGNRYTEVPYLAQDTVFEDIENIASKDPQLHGYNESTPYLIKLKNIQ